MARPSNDESPEHQRLAQQVEQAFARGQAAFAQAGVASGARKEALRWLDRAHRLAPADGTIALMLASATLGGDNPAAAVLFRDVLDRADVRDAWLGLATAGFLTEEWPAAGDALAQMLARHALRPDVHALADRIARETGAPGWCGMTGAGVVIARPVGTGPIAMAIDGKPLACGPSGDCPLPVAWPRCRSVTAMIGDRHLIGSPISLRAIGRVEGEVEDWEGGLRGWAWCPADPDADPGLAVSLGRVRTNIAMAGPAIGVPGLAPLAQPRAFSVSWKELPAGVRAARVRGRDGRVLVSRPDGKAFADRRAGRKPEVVKGRPRIERHLRVIEHHPQVIERSPEVIERHPKVIERSPEVIERHPQVIERSPEVVERHPQAIERHPQVIERPPRVIERHPRARPGDQSPHDGAGTDPRVKPGDDGEGFVAARDGTGADREGTEVDREGTGADRERMATGRERTAAIRERTGATRERLAAGFASALATSVVLITHDDGGGVERRIQAAIASHTASGRRVIVLRPTKPGDGPIGVIVDTHGQPTVRLELPRQRGALMRVLRDANPGEIELHHFLNHDPSVFGIVQALGVPYDVHTHDYAWFCPRIALVGRANRYCGEPAVPVCETCVAKAGTYLHEPIGVADLLERSRAILRGARRVVSPSHDAAGRMARHFPGLSPIVVPHEDDAAIDDPPPIPLVGGTVRVCVAGAIGPHKGYDVLLACARDAKKRKLALEFVVAGTTTGDGRLMDTGHVFVTGPYQPAEAVALIRAQDAALALLPSIWPETWCLGLTELWRAGLRVAAFDTGAPAERIRRTGRGFLLPLGLPAGAINDTLLNAAGGRSFLPVRRSSAYKPSTLMQP